MSELTWNRIIQLEKENSDLRRKLDVAREALGFYGDLKNWAAAGYANEFDIAPVSDQERISSKQSAQRVGDFICGKRARAALKEIE